MVRAYALLAFLAYCTAYVTDTPSFVDRLYKLNEKLEKLTVAPTNKESVPEDLYAKLERLNSITPDRSDLSEDDEELLSAIQQWGVLSGDQLRGMMKELERMKYEPDEDKNDGEYLEGYWNDEDHMPIYADGDSDYANDDWDDDPESSTPKYLNGVTPAAFTKSDQGYRETVLSAIDPIAATNERPRILDDSMLTAADRSALRTAAFRNMKTVVHSGKCLIPQPRWLALRQLAPAADTTYMPPCVQLHRCSPDAGCCYNEAEVCAPVEGKHVAIPFYLNKADGNINVARLLFFNHTRCACVSRETLQTTTRSRTEAVDVQESPKRETQVASSRPTEWKSTTEEPRLEKDEATAPPQIRRCTCPGLFMARITEDVCTCICDWRDLSRRRDCLSLARGREHFGMRDRVCVANGDCTPPTCEYGAYERNFGRCPQRRYKRFRYQRRFQTEKTAA